MNTSNQSYKAYSFADHKEVYLLLENTFKAFDVHYYLIGANARDVELYKANQKPNRGTADIDFAVMLPDIETYTAITDHLKTKGFADAYGKEPHRLFHEKSNTVIDLLPYGELESNYTVKFTDRNIELSVIGFKEVGEDVQNFEHPAGLSIPVTPAHGIVILKLISWSKKNERVKDLKDIKALLDAAWQLYENEFYCENSEYSYLTSNNPFEMETVAAHIMGRKMQNILNKNNDLKSLIKTQLKNELTDETGPKTKIIAVEEKMAVEEIKKLFTALLDGVNYK